MPSGERMEDKEVLDADLPLSRIVPISPNKLTLYRIVIIMRLTVLGLFFNYRITNPVESAYSLWLTSIICENWFAISWLLDQFPKWSPITREMYVDRLSLRYEREGNACMLAPVDFFVSTVDPLKEPPLITANTMLSILAVDYPVEKVSCYVSDDGAAMLSFESLAETANFSRQWVPFCKKYSIEPRAPESYFLQTIDYLRDKIQPSFVKEQRAMKRDYEEYKVRVNALVAKALKTPEEGWTMQDGTPWPGNNPRDHPGMIQVSENAHFGMSLFERLSSLGHKKHLLGIQYRMHPSISKFPNSSFYGNRISDGPNVKCLSYEKSYLSGSIYGAYSLINIERGKETSDKFGRSKKNMIEVAVISHIVKRLFKDQIRVC